MILLLVIPFTDIDGIMDTLKSFSKDAFSLETVHLYNMMALHNFFLNFVRMKILMVWVA